MDSGMNAEGVYNLDEARNLKLFSESDLTIPQVIAIVDQLLCCEVNFKISLNFLTTSNQFALH